MKFAINVVLGHSTHTLIVEAQDRDSAYDEARSLLVDCRLHSASLQGTARVASQTDLDNEWSPVFARF